MDRLLKEADIQEFQQLVKEYCGAELTAEDAVAVAEQLLRTLHIVREVALKSLPPPKDDFGFGVPKE